MENVLPSADLIRVVDVSVPLADSIRVVHPNGLELVDPSKYGEEFAKHLEIESQIKEQSGFSVGPDGGKVLEASHPVFSIKGMGEHKFSSTQFNLMDAGYSRSQGSPIKKIMEMNKRIPDSALWSEDGNPESGREEEIHLTVKYGLYTQHAFAVQRVIRDFGPVVIRLGKTSIFQAEKYDVVKIDVSGDDVFRLNELISESLECTDTHPEYKPHVTLAYVKAGLGKDFVGWDDVDGYELHCDTVIFSDCEGNRTKIPTIGLLQPLQKDLSWLDSNRGGSLVKPPSQKIPTSPFRNKRALTGFKLDKSIRMKYKAIDPHEGENCPHCDTPMERGDDGNCNHCGKPWPIGQKGLFASVESVGRWLADRWTNLEERYGRKVALTMALGILATMPIPFSMPAIIAAAETYRGLKGYSSYAVKHFEHLTKDRGSPCKQGEAASRTGCIPALKKPAPKKTSPKKPLSEKPDVLKTEARQAWSERDTQALTNVATKIKQSGTMKGRAGIGVAGLREVAKLVGLKGTTKFKKAGLVQALYEHLTNAAKSDPVKETKDRLSRIQEVEKGGIAFKDRLINAIVAYSPSIYKDEKYKEAIADISANKDNAMAENIAYMKAIRRNVFKDLKEGKIDKPRLDAVLKDLADGGYGSIKPEEVNDYLDGLMVARAEQKAGKAKEGEIIPDNLSLAPAPKSKKERANQKPEDYIDRLRVPLSSRMDQLKQKEKQTGTPFTSWVLNQLIDDSNVDLPGREEYGKLVAALGQSGGRGVSPEGENKMRNFRKVALGKLKHGGIRPERVASALERLDKENYGTLRYDEFEKILKKVNPDLDRL